MNWASVPLTNSDWAPQVKALPSTKLPSDVASARTTTPDRCLKRGILITLPKFAYSRLPSRGGLSHHLEQRIARESLAQSLHLPVALFDVPLSKTCESGLR